MFKPFSIRNSNFSYRNRRSIPKNAKTRILVILDEHLSNSSSSLHYILPDIETELFKQYGTLQRPAYTAARNHDNPVIDHFYRADDEMTFDFIEICLKQRDFTGRDQVIDDINEIFLQNEILVELTYYVTNVEEPKSGLLGGFNKSYTMDIEYPRFILKENSLLHREVVQPCLELLSDSRFKVSNEEMLRAHNAFRHGHYESSITLSCSAYESFLKSICEINNWDFDAERDTCSKLVKKCHAKGAFPSFYIPVLESVGTIRNKVGDAHGRGPKVIVEINKSHANHIINIASSNMLFLANAINLK